MKERTFVTENIRRAQLEEFLEKEFTRAGYSHAEIQRTPLAMRITIFAQKPGMIIGRGGKTIDTMTETIKQKFGFENPQLDVQEVENPDLDPHIVSKQIAAALERGLNTKRVISFTMQRVIEAGAVGIAIRLAGKIGGEMGRIEKYSAGYLRFAGDPAETDVSTAYANTTVKLGKIGVQVRILVNPPKELEAMKRILAQTASK